MDRSYTYSLSSCLLYRMNSMLQTGWCNVPSSVLPSSPSAHGRLRYHLHFRSVQFPILGFRCSYRRLASPSRYTMLIKAFPSPRIPTSLNFSHQVAYLSTYYTHVQQRNPSTQVSAVTYCFHQASKHALMSAAGKPHTRLSRNAVHHPRNAGCYSPSSLWIVTVTHVTLHLTHRIAGLQASV